MRTLQLFLVGMGLLSFLFGGCGKKSAPQSPSDSNAPIIKIAVFADGRFTVDGAASSLPELAEALKRHSERQGVVWYYREAGRDAPPLIAMDIFKTVMDAGLPIRLSSRPDYSDYIDEQGRSGPAL